MDDPELKAITVVTTALADLTEEQCRNVLLYVNARYGSRPLPPSRGRVSVENEETAPNGQQFDGVGDFFDSANPQTEAEKVLVVAYWMQVVEQAEDFESYPVNQQLKNLGHPVSNITRALDSMMGQAPRLVMQTSKSGTSKQARKRYKVTRVGTKRVQAMLTQATGETHAA
jgi:hypothetical protein